MQAQATLASPRLEDIQITHPPENFLGDTDGQRVNKAYPWQHIS